MYTLNATHGQININFAHGSFCMFSDRIEQLSCSRAHNQYARLSCLLIQVGFVRSTESAILKNGVFNLCKIYLFLISCMCYVVIAISQKRSRSQLFCVNTGHSYHTNMFPTMMKCGTQPMLFLWRQLKGIYAVNCWLIFICRISIMLCNRHFCAFFQPVCDRRPIAEMDWP